MGILRQEILQLQRQIFSDLELEIKETLGKLPPTLEKYYRDYRKEFLQHEAVVTRQDLMQRIRNSSIVYCGDYHTLKQAQMMNVTLLREIVGGRKIILAMELVHSEYQQVLDQYMQGQIDDEQFLKGIRYRKTFGFEWMHYKPIFEFARYHDLPVYGIDHHSGEKQSGLEKRDLWAARVIADITIGEPDAIVWVIIGDLHLARTHLPRRVEKELAGRGEQRKFLILHQNNENLFWKLARKQLPREDLIVKMNKDAYCILNTPPWVKLHSYVAWLQGAAGEEPSPEAAVTEEVPRLIRFLTRFLKIEEDAAADLTIYVGDDPSVIQEFNQRSDEHKAFREKFRRKQSFIDAGRRIIYLAYADINHAAEMAARYIHAVCGGFNDVADDSRDAFFRRVCHEALGFAGSKIVNHHRHAPQHQDLLSLLRIRKDRRSRSAKGNLKLDVQKKDARELALTLTSGDVERFISEDAGFGYKISRYLGKRMGNEMYEQLVNEKLPRVRLRSYFCGPLTDPGEAEKLFNRFRPANKPRASALQKAV